MLLQHTKTQEVERLRLAFATLAPILFRKAAKFDDARLIGMQLKTKVRESLAQPRQDRSASSRCLESCHEVNRHFRHLGSSVARHRHDPHRPTEPQRKPAALHTVRAEFVLIILGGIDRLADNVVVNLFMFLCFLRLW